MPDIKVSQVPIFTAPESRRTRSASPGRSDVTEVSTDAAQVSPEERWQGCRISADVAVALGIPADDLASGKGGYRVRISVTEADVNVLFNPGYVEFLGKSDSFVVDGLTSGSHRVEIHANSGPGMRDGGVFKLFGGGNPFTGADIPTNARVTLWRDELSVDRDEKLDSQGGKRSRRLEVAFAGAGRPAKRDKVRWLMALIP